MLCGYYKRAIRLLYGCYENAVRKLPYSGAIRVLPLSVLCGCYKNAVGIISGCYMGAIRVLSK